MGTPWPAARPDPLTRARRLHADLGHAIAVAEHVTGNRGRSLALLDDKILAVALRAGVTR